MEKLKEHSFLAFLVSNWVDAAKELFKQAPPTRRRPPPPPPPRRRPRRRRPPAD